jgi:hypothetical protein
MPSARLFVIKLSTDGRIGLRASILDSDDDLSGISRQVVGALVRSLLNQDLSGITSPR